MSHAKQSFHLKKILGAKWVFLCEEIPYLNLNLFNIFFEFFHVPKIVQTVFDLINEKKKYFEFPFYF